MNRFSRGQAYARAHSPFTNVTLYNCFRPHSRPEVPFHSWIGHNGGFTRLLRTPASRHAPATSPSPSHSHSLPPFHSLTIPSLSLSLLVFSSPSPLSPIGRSFSRTRTHAPQLVHRRILCLSSSVPFPFHSVSSSSSSKPVPLPSRRPLSLTVQRCTNSKGSSPPW